MTVFLSHTHSDKPVVEPLAIALQEILGKENVFYDTWSIQPGDGIIEKMNDGLSAPQFVFFFVSEASLKSKMVGLEWQNALWKATKGDCKIIPVRVDGSAMPSLLSQTLYIDLFANGIEVAKHQIISLIQGTKGFEPQFSNFSNLTWTATGTALTEVTIKISVSRLMEPNPAFLILTDNDETQIEVSLADKAPHIGGFTKNIEVGSVTTNCFAISPFGGAITPKLPLYIKVKYLKGAGIVIHGVMHKTEHDKYSSIPFRSI